MGTIFLIILAGVFIFWFFILRNDEKWVRPKQSFPKKWRIVLAQKINFYNALSPKEKPFFEFKVQEFLLNHQITGIGVKIDIADKLLVASSAIIPIFKFPDWRYHHLFEVILYPSTFNEDFETTGNDRRILGMVGTGYMEGKMILSKPALHLGFDNTSDKKNTAIHEFIHLIDKADGQIDGIPSLLLERPYVLPWLDLMNKKMDEIYQKESDINPYGGTNKIEFFAVACEFFFERPKLLAKKHPKLYQHLEEIFNHEMDDRNLNKRQKELGRNSPCPCGSGKKFKHCCGK